MKKSSVLVKILLSMVIVALAFALVACNGDKEPDDGPQGGNEPKEEATLTEQIMEIVGGVNPLLNTINETKAGDTLGADVSLDVNYKFGESQGAHALALKATANTTAPALQVSYKNGKDTANKEWFNLTYSDKKIYLVQPVTSVNETKFYDKDGKAVGATDATVSDVAALNPAVTDIMTIAMTAIEKLHEKEPIGIPETLETTINQMISQLGTGISQLLKITHADNKYSLVLDAKVMNALSLFAPDIIKGAISGFVGEDIAANISTAVGNFLATNPTLAIEVSINPATKAIKGIGIDYTSPDGKDTLNLSIGLELTKAPVTINVPRAEDKALNIGFEAELPQKQAKATLELKGVADLSADGNNLVYANLVTEFGAKKANSYGYFDGSSVNFNTAALSVVGNANNNNNYKATIQREETEGNRVPDSIVAIINRAAKEAKESYLASLAAPANADEPVVPTKGIDHIIYEWLGGKVTVDKDGNYAPVTEQAMMAQLKTNIGDYVRFEIDDSSKSNNYFNTVKNIVALFAANDEWIIGGDLVKEDLSALKGWSDALNFDKWINKGTKCEGGIFNWDSANYNGGIVLSADGEKNDLLDVVNVFVATGKTAEDAPIDVDAKFLADFVNYYIAALGYYTGEFDATAMEAIDKIDMKLAYAKCQNIIYGNETEEELLRKKEALSTAKKEHKDALKEYYTAEVADRVLAKILGGTYSTETSVVEQLINGGLYFNLGSEKGKGLYGYVEIRNAIDGDVVYAKVSAHINLVDNTVEADVTAAKAQMDAANAKELYNPVKVTENDADKDNYVKHLTEQGVLWVQYDSKTDTYSYVPYSLDDVVQYNDRYTEAEELLQELYQAAIDYLNSTAA